MQAPLRRTLLRRPAQAIKDAFALAGCLQGADRSSARQALERYEGMRRPRTRQVQLMSRRKLRNHLPDGPEQQQRDAQFAKGDPLRESAWLYGYDPGADGFTAPLPRL